MRLPWAIPLLAILFVAACTTPATHGLTGGTFSGEGGKAIVVLENMTDAKTFTSVYFDTYDAQAERFSKPDFNFAFITTKGGYLFDNAEPGDYLLSKVTIDKNFNLCFHEETIRVTIEPGKVNYIGGFDERLYRLEVQKRRTAEPLPPGRFEYYTDNVPAPVIVAPSSQDVAQLERYLAANLPDITAPITTVAMAPASYRAPKTNRLIGLTCRGN